MHEFSTTVKKVLVHTCSLCSKNRTMIILEIPTGQV
jgi:hypothetical protein